MGRKFLLFISLIVAADWAIGRGLDLLYRRCLAGEMGGLINFSLKKDADLLVLGSSRARHHFVPEVFKQKLGLRAYNAGLDGQDLLYALMLFDVWTSVHGAPKIVILEVDPLTFERSKDELQRASVFAPYADHSAKVREILSLRGRYERVKLWSYAYRYNGKVLAILKNLSSPLPDSFDGYVGLASRKTGALDEVIPIPDLKTPFWDEKLALFDEFASYCRTRGVRLVLVHSPHYGADAARETIWRSEMRELLKRYPDVRFIDADTLYASRFSARPDLFRDSIHLTDRGAEMFSALVADELRKTIVTTASFERDRR